jgi:hypothetical protein
MRSRSGGLTIAAVVVAGWLVASAPAAADPGAPGPSATPRATGAVTPIVELPGGSNQRPPGVVAGAQTRPATSVKSLPSSSTDRTPAIPLALLGLAITAVGGILLRRGGPPQP